MPRRHFRRAGLLLAKHYKLGCSGLQSKQVHFKAHAAYSVHANPAGALIYQKSSAVQTATHRPSHSSSISHAQLSSSHSFAARPYLLLKTPHTRTTVLPYMSSSTFAGSRPVQFRPPCFSARPFTQRTHSHSQPSAAPSITPIPGRVLRRLRVPGTLGLRQQSSFEPRVSESSPLWGLAQLSSRQHSSSHGSRMSQTGPMPRSRAGFRDCVRDSYPEASHSGRQHGATSRSHDRGGLWGRAADATSEQRMSSFQAGLAELCREQHAQRSRPWPGQGHDAGAVARRSQTAELAAELTYLSSRRDVRSSQLGSQHRVPTHPSPRRVTQSHGGLDRLAHAMHSRSQAANRTAASSLNPGAPGHVSRRSLDRHRIRQQRNQAALSTLQTIFE